MLLPPSDCGSFLRDILIGTKVKWLSMFLGKFFCSSPVIIRVILACGVTCVWCVWYDACQLDVTCMWYDTFQLDVTCMPVSIFHQTSSAAFTFSLILLLPHPLSPSSFFFRFHSSLIFPSSSTTPIFPVFPWIPPSVFFIADAVYHRVPSHSSLIPPSFTLICPSFFLILFTLIPLTNSLCASDEQHNQLARHYDISPRLPRGLRRVSGVRWAHASELVRHP